MNAADDKEKLEEASGGSSSSSDMCRDRRGENDCCGRPHPLPLPLHNNSAAAAAAAAAVAATLCNGARPKNNQPPSSLTCNIPNGIAHNNYSLKLNNNSLDSDKIHNGNDMDVYMRNNVDCCVSIDKCPAKVKKHVGGDECKPVKQYRRDDDDSLSENEEEDEYCIYTYKGDENQMADLPSSFFRLGVVPPGGRGRGSRSSSPDMDYLEMDFDPGPSNDRGDSSDDSDCCDMQHDERQDIVSNEEASPHEQDLHTEEEDEDVQPLDEYHLQLAAVNRETKNDLSGCRNLPTLPPPPPPAPPAAVLPPAQPPPLPSTSSDDSWRYHCSTSAAGGDLCSPGEPVDSTLYKWSGVVDYLNTQSDSATDAEKYNLRSALYHCIMAKRLVLDKQASFTDCDQSNMLLKENKEASSPDANRPLEKIMIWSEKEAGAKQITQIGTSLCGATAIFNVMVALNMPFSLDKLKEALGTRLRKEDAPLAEYLLSRCVAGVTHQDLIRGVDVASQGSLYARFFHMYPARNFSLLRWLASWMKKGAIAIATLNLQRGVAAGEVVPDFWHHQMVFGVGPRGVYMTNPLECLDESTLQLQLCSPSVLRVRRTDVLNRWTPSTDLTPLTKQADIRWKKMNVLGQVVNIIREEKWNRQGLNRTLTSHISIPASFSSGITLILPRENPAFDQLRNAPELLVKPT